MRRGILTKPKLIMLPERRDPKLVLEAVLNNKASVRAARLSYGVIIYERRKTVNLRDTVKEREKFLIDQSVR